MGYTGGNRRGAIVKTLKDIAFLGPFDHDSVVDSECSVVQGRLAAHRSWRRRRRAQQGGVSHSPNASLSMIGNPHISDIIMNQVNMACAPDLEAAMTSSAGRGASSSPLKVVV